MLTSFSIPLHEKDGVVLADLTVYLMDNPPEYHAAPDFSYPAMVVFPGGGYTHLSPREGEPIAFEFLAKGFQTFVVHYSLLPETFPQPLLDAARALTIIREHASEWCVNPDQIAICGFSAGGHLCASLSTLWNGKLLTDHGIDPEKARPNAAILGYAVVETAGKQEEFGRQFLGGHWEDPDYQILCHLPDAVGEQNPPTFIWHTASDPVVPIQNALHMAEALSKVPVPFELHIYPEGPHGMALANKHTNNGNPAMDRKEVAGWMPCAIDFLSRTFNYKL